MPKKKIKNISGWFIYWFGTSTKIPSDEMARIIFIYQYIKRDRPEPIADFVEKYYISTMYLSEKIALASPKSRRNWNSKSKTEYNKKKNGFIISCGHNPMIIAEYRENFPVPDKDYPTWFPK